MRLEDSVPNPLQRGSLFENRVALNVISTVDWSEERIAVRHWRNQKKKQEVDLLLVHPNGKTVPIEVKSSRQVGPENTRGLVAYAAEYTPIFYAGYVVYGGTRVVDLTPPGLPPRSILAVPADVFLGG